MFGELSHELEIEVPASEAWNLIGTLRLAMLVRNLKSLFQNIEVVQGDGGVGTIVNLTFAPGIPGFTTFKEKFIKIDNEDRVKETELIEGAYLEMGFTRYKICIQVIEKSESSCSVKYTIKYELPDELAERASMVTTDFLEMVFNLAREHLLGLHCDDDSVAKSPAAAV